MRDISTLRRASDDRMIAGVAEGLSRHFDVDPILIRVVLAALTLFGGAGICLYVIAWVTIPEEGRYDSALSRLLRRDPNRVMAAGLVVAAVIGIGTTIGAIGFSSPNPFPVIIIAGLVIAVLAVFSRRGDRHQAPYPGPSAPAATYPPGYVPPPAPTAYQQPEPDAVDGEGTGPTMTATTTAEQPPPTREWWQRPASGGPSGPGAPMPPPGAFVPPPPPPARRPRSHLFALTMAVIAIAIGALWILDATVIDDMEPSVYPGTVLGITAVALLVGAWYGRSRLLIFVGVLATAVTLIAAAAGPGPYGERIYRPERVTELRSNYEVGVGRLAVHLEDIADPENLDGQTIALDARIGQVEVVVPSTMPVIVDAHVDHGEILGPNRSAVDDLDGDGQEVVLSSVTDGTGALNIEIDLDFGEIVISQFACPTTGNAPESRGLATTNLTGGIHAAPACN